MKLHVSIVALSTKDSANLIKQLNEGFKRSVYYNSYETKPVKVIEKAKNLYELLTASFQGVKWLFVLVYAISAPVGGNPADDTAGIKGNKSIFSQEKKLKITTYWSMEEIFMINQLMT